jgi:5-methylcytosine-specific restriction endonuclease McrA
MSRFSKFSRENNELAKKIRGTRVCVAPMPKVEAVIIDMAATHKNFLESKAWKKLRKKALKHYGNICMHCGRESERPNVDHIKPRARFPWLALDFNNLQILCRRCNKAKGNKNTTDWRQSYVETRIDRELNARFKFLISS